MNSILLSTLGLVDAALCLVVALAACDYLRRLHPIDQPLLSAAFYLVAIGAFGAFVTSIQGLWVSPFGVMLHTGVVLYAWVRRNHMFEVGMAGGYQPKGGRGPHEPPPKNP